MGVGDAVTAHPCNQCVLAALTYLTQAHVQAGPGTHFLQKSDRKAKHDQLREHTHTAYSVSCAEFKSETQHSQADIYMYSVISEPAAGSIKSISHQARRSATFKYNYFVACNGRLHTNAEGW